MFKSSFRKTSKSTTDKECIQTKRMPLHAQLLYFPSNDTLCNDKDESLFPNELVTLIEKVGYFINAPPSSLSNNNDVLFVIIYSYDKNVLISQTRKVRKLYNKAFICVWHPDATEDPFLRQGSFGLTIEGCNMVIFNLIALFVSLLISLDLPFSFSFIHLCLF